MMNVMQFILNIENKAQSMVADADKIKQDFEDELEVQKQKIIAEQTLAAEEKIRKCSLEISENEKRELRVIDEKCKHQLSVLEEKFSANKERWIEEISNSIIGFEN